MVGDSTTITAILTHAIAECAIEEMDGAKISSREMIDDLDTFLATTLKKIDKHTKAATNKKILNNIALTSCNRDKLIAKSVSDVYDTIGVHGHISLKKGTKRETTIKYIDGLKFNGRIAHPSFINNMTNSAYEISNPYIIITDLQLYNSAQVRPIVDLMGGKLKSNPNSNFVIICREMSGEALGLFIHNNQNPESPYHNRIAVINAPESDIYQKDILQDIADFVGGKFLSESAGHTATNLSGQYLGSAGTLIATQQYTVIHDPQNFNQERLDALDKRISQLEDGNEKDALKNRFAALHGKTAEILVGGGTDIDITEKFFRYEDAIGAVKSAMEGGYIPGGETVLLRIAYELSEDYDSMNWYSMALLEPFFTLTENAGIPDALSVIREFLSDYNIGIDVISKETCHLINRGIIDSAKSIKVALQNAVDAAKIIINTEVTLTSK
jgi:chaperonin GroEL